MHKNIAKEKLNTILKYTCNNIPYYNKKVSINIEDFPIVNKSIIRENLEQFINPNIDQKVLKPVVTSGSTGTPFKVYHDSIKRFRNTADTIFFAKLAGYEIGQKLFYLKIWNDFNYKNKLKQFIENIVPIDVLNLSEQNIQKLLSNFNKCKSPFAILSYSSVLDTIAKYINKNNILPVQTKICAIIAMSESFPKETQNCISDYFNVKAVSRYSNVENGIIAQQSCENQKEFIINEASYFVETLKFYKDEPAGYGNPGRIVVTDLYNYGMPMIRYDTGDVGTMNIIEIDGMSKNVLTDIEGRKMDCVYNTKNELVSSFTITNNMWKYQEIEQYQFIQETTNIYKFKINIKGKFKREKVLIEEFKGYFGKDANIHIEYVNEIPLLDSGKRKKVVNMTN